MANKKISDLTGINAGDITNSMLWFITDPSGTNYKLTHTEFLTLISILGNAKKFGFPGGDTTLTENRTVTGQDTFGLNILNLASLNLGVYNGSFNSTRVYGDDATTEFYSPQGQSAIGLQDGQFYFAGPIIIGQTSDQRLRGNTPFFSFIDENDDNAGFIFRGSNEVEHSRFYLENNGDLCLLTSSKYPTPSPLVVYWNMSTKELFNTGPLNASNNFNSDRTPHILSTTTGINAKTVANTNLYTVPAGKTAIITEAVVRVTAANTITVPPTLGIGIAAGEDDIFAATVLTGLDTTTKVYKFNAANTYVAGAATNIIKLGIDVGATATTMTISIDLIGYLI